MANKSLTDLTARTATADSDLLHINSGGTDYKETKSDFTKNLAKWVDFGNSSALTTQIDALSGDCAYEGIILSYGHQAETGVPINANFYVDVIKIASGAGRVKIYALNSSAKPVSYINFKSGGSWQGWVQDPMRDEITSLNNSLANITEWHWADNILQNNWSSNGMSVYGKIKDIGFVQFSVRNGTLNTTAAILPSGFRPSTYSVVVPLLANGANNGYALINTNGTIVFNGQTTASCFFNAIFPVA